MKLEFSLIDQLIKVIGLKSFQSLLWDRIKESFNESFGATQTEFDFKRTKPDPEALEYLKQRQFILSQKTIDRLHGDLRFNLLEGIQANDSIKEMIERIRPIFDRMKSYELERLARTEVLNAMAAGRQNAHLKSGISKYKVWKAHKDARTGSDSLRLHGQIQRIDDPFVDYETGITCMHNPNRPNDRCTVIYLRKLPENIIYKHGYMYNGDYLKKIEIDIESLTKQEKHYEYVTVHPKKGRSFKRKQLVGRKEPEKKEKKSEIRRKETAMTPDNVENVHSLNDIGVEGNLHDLESFIVEFKDKSQALYKTMEPIDIIGETNAFKVNEVLGWGIVPETVKGDFGHGEGSCQKWVEGEEPYDSYNDYGEKITEKNIDDLAKIFAFDVIVNNRDRHVGNFLVNKDRIWAIDNEEFGFPDMGEYLMSRLDDACNYGNRGGYGILQSIENSFGDDQKVFKNFRSLVVDRLKEIVDRKNEILEIYEPIEGYKVKREAIEESFDSIKDRILELEEKK